MVTCKLVVTCVILIFGLGMQNYSCDADGTFGFDIHHRFSDAVKGIFPTDDLPEMGSLGFYQAMVHRDRLVHGRRLSTANQTDELTFINGNKTFYISSLGFLHYANVSVGTPGLSFLVALDTGSDLFWLPCDCTECVHSLNSSNGNKTILNIYSPGNSSTSASVPCNSTLCESKRQCSATPETCPYAVSYLSVNTSSSGVLVEDILHLRTDSSVLEPVNVSITLGCGKVQTGSFLKGAAPNGLFGLGIEDVSVPSILAAKGLTSNSFSMCFGHEGIGRIVFGDKGGSDQGQTPFNIEARHPTYNVSITQINVGDNTTNINFTAIIDTGTSFTYLTEPVYSLFAKSFDAQIKEMPTKYNISLPFEYCYDLGVNQTTFEIPIVNLTMGGGDPFHVTRPYLPFLLSGATEQYGFCLAIIKSEDINLIGQNFMRDYRLVFDREKMVLGWKESNCDELEDTKTLPITPNSTATPPTVSPTVSPAKAPAPLLNNSGTTTATPPSDSSRLSKFSSATGLMILFAFFAIF